MIECAFCCGKNNNPPKQLRFISYQPTDKAEKQEGYACPSCVEIIYAENYGKKDL